MFEPSPEALRDASAALADYYNEPHNAALLCNTIVFTPEEVRSFWHDALADGGRAFLLFRDGALVGDADFRNFLGDAAELALLIGPRECQGVGLGRRFAPMLLALGFGSLGLEKVYVAIRPANAASLAMFARTGFVPDASLEARSYAEEDDDVCLGLGRATFLEGHAEMLRQIDLRA